LRQLLSDAPGNVDLVIFPNYVSEKDLFKYRILFDLVNSITLNMLAYVLFQESSVERDDIKEPFSEVYSL
jgi:hypothetical protein